MLDLILLITITILALIFGFGCFICIAWFGAAVLTLFLKIIIPIILVVLLIGLGSFMYNMYHS